MWWPSFCLASTIIFILLFILFFSVFVVALTGDISIWSARCIDEASSPPATPWQKVDIQRKTPTSMASQVASRHSPKKYSHNNQVIHREPLWNGAIFKRRAIVISLAFVCTFCTKLADTRHTMCHKRWHSFRFARYESTKSSRAKNYDALEKV